MSFGTDSSSPTMLTLMQLPCELRTLIWHESMPEDVSETCIIVHETPTTISQRGATHVHEPFVVDTGFPVLMHICHEARAFAMKQTRFRYSHKAGTMVPFRLFSPAIDVLYVHGTQDLSSLRFVEEPVFKEVRRLALGCWRPLCAATPSRPASAACVFGVFPRVESVSVVLPSSQELPSRQKLYPSPPTGRFRLEPVYVGCARNSMIISSFKDVDRSANGLLSFMHRIRCDIACYHARMWRTLGPQAGGDAGFIDVDLNARYFSAYSHDAFGASRSAFRDSLQFPDGFREHDINEMTARGGPSPDRVRVNDLH